MPSKDFSPLPPTWGDPGQHIKEGGADHPLASRGTPAGQGHREEVAPVYEKTVLARGADSARDLTGDMIPLGG